MPSLSSTARFDYTMTAGSDPAFTATLMQADGSTPYPITGWTWEYVVRTTQTDTSGTPVIKLTTAANSQGVLTVGTFPSSTVQVQLYPPATAIGSINPGQYWHALWANPGSATAQQNIFWGSFMVQAAPEP